MSDDPNTLNLDPWAKEQKFYEDCLNSNVDCKVSYLKQLNEPDYCCTRGVNINSKEYDGVCGIAGEAVFNCYKQCKPITKNTPDNIYVNGYTVDILDPKIEIIGNIIRLYESSSCLISGGRYGIGVIIAFKEGSHTLTIEGTKLFVSTEKVEVEEGIVKVRDAENNVLKVLNAGDKFNFEDIPKLSQTISETDIQTCKAKCADETARVCNEELYPCLDTKEADTCANEVGIKYRCCFTGLNCEGSPVIEKRNQCYKNCEKGIEPNDSEETDQDNDDPSNEPKPTTSGDWGTTILDISTNTSLKAHDPSVAYDSKGIPHAVWVYGENNKEEIWYRYWNGSSWINEVVPNYISGMPDLQIGRPKIAVADNGKVHVVWHVFHPTLKKWLIGYRSKDPTTNQWGPITNPSTGNAHAGHPI